jgi:DNA-binding response OmpR family regulator
MYRILIAEDDDKLRCALRDYFCNKGFYVYDADNGIKAMQLADTEEFDISILDVMMPEADGFTVCEHIRKTSDVPVIFLTARTAEEDQLHGFEVSADDYVTKPFSLAVLYARTEALLHRYAGRKQDSKLMAPGIEIDTDARVVSVDGITTELPPRVYDLLVYMMQNQGRILTREQILDHVWGSDAFIYDRAVDGTIKKLRHCLGARSGYIHTIIKVGYRFEVKDDEKAI